jgi:predicted O-linked N-acetylglucosamine transferase (SPINDLY family)
MELPINGLPAEKSGLVTFGCLNNFGKINEPLLRLWGRVIEKVRASRLVILTDEGSHRKRTLEILDREGVEAHRVEFVASRPRKGYLELYHRLDMALDPFPYNGHSTSLDALWMGVPVVSLAGDVPVSRAGWSQLSNVGLAELVAFSEDDYVRIAADLAGDLARLAQLRATLRHRMQASRLMDAPGYARSIEASYRTMWREWCAQQSLPLS